MPDIISTGVSGLNAVRTMMDVAGHNIANVDTPGYTRERVDLVSRYSGESGLNIGSGVDVAAITRLNNQFLENQIQHGESDLASFGLYRDVFRNIGEVVNNDQTGLGDSISSLNKSLSAIINTPSDPNTRAAFFDAARVLVDRFQRAKDQLNSVSSSVQDSIQQDVKEANLLIQKIAALNANISSVEHEQGTAAANDLRDQRQQAIKELNQYLPVNLIDSGQGNVSLYTGSGQVLIQGSQAFPLVVTQGNKQNNLISHIRIQYENTQSDLENQIHSGKLGAALDLQENVIQKIKNQLGITVAGIADQFNRMQADGLTINGEWGKPIFTIANPQIQQDPAQQDHVTLTAGFSNIAAVKASDYDIHFDGARWHIVRDSDGHEDVFDKLPSEYDGMTLTITGAPQTGDHFTISPGADVLDGFRLAMTSPDDIATALPIRAKRGEQNTGTLKITHYEIDPNAKRPLSDLPNLMNRVHIRFTDSSHYNLTSDDGTVLSANQEYTAGQPISLNGWRVSLDGMPKTGDEIIVEKNTDARGDTLNLQSVTNFANKGYFDNGQKNIASFYSEITERIGTQSREAAVHYDSQNKLLQGLNKERASISGVNLDEEASTLLRLQELYAANAKVIQIGSHVLDSLIALFQ